MLPPVGAGHPRDGRERARKALWAVFTQVRGSMRDRFAEHGLTVPQAMSLFTLAHGAQTPGRLAEALGVSPGNVTGILDRLEARGLVRRRPRADDRRSVELALSPAGRRMVAALGDAAGEALDEGFGRLRPRELRQLCALLERLSGAQPEGPALLPRPRRAASRRPSPRARSP